MGEGLAAGAKTVRKGENSLRRAIGLGRGAGYRLKTMRKGENLAAAEGVVCGAGWRPHEIENQ